MRHRNKTIKLGRPTAQREALLAGLVCDLIGRKRITTTVAKAKATRTIAEKMVTLAKQGTPAAWSRALSKLRQKSSVSELFTALAPAFKDRAGGYTRIMRLKRRADSSEMVVLEWVNYIPKPRKEKKEKAADKSKGAESSKGSEPSKGKEEKKAKESKASAKK